MNSRIRFLGLPILGALLAWGAGTPVSLHAEPMEGMKQHPDGGHQGIRHHGDRHHADRQHGNRQDFAGHFLGGLQRHAKDLGLSTEQRTTLKGIRTNYAKARIRDKADMKLAEVDVRSLAHDDKTEMSAIEAAVQKAEAAHAAVRLDGIKAVRTAMAVLTPEQREKWRTGYAAMHRAEGGEGGNHESAAAALDHSATMEANSMMAPDAP